MRIGVLVGRTDSGDLHYLGKPGDMDAVKNLASSIMDSCGEHNDKQYNKLWICDVSRKPTKTKKPISRQRMEEKEAALAANSTDPEKEAADKVKAKAAKKAK